MGTSGLLPGSRRSCLCWQAHVEAAAEGCKGTLGSNAGHPAPAARVSGLLLLTFLRNVQAHQKRLPLRLIASLLLDPAAGRPAPDNLSLGPDAGQGLEAPASSPGAFSTMLQAWMAARSIPAEAQAVGELRHARKACCLCVQCCTAATLMQVCGQPALPLLSAAASASAPGPSCSPEAAAHQRLPFLQASWPLASSGTGPM